MKTNPKSGAVNFHCAGEKLHQKAHWQLHRMIFDLLPYFEGDEAVEQVLLLLLYHAHAPCTHTHAPYPCTHISHYPTRPYPYPSNPYPYPYQPPPPPHQPLPTCCCMCQFPVSSYVENFYMPGFPFAGRVWTGRAGKGTGGVQEPHGAVRSSRGRAKSQVLQEMLRELRKDAADSSW